MPQMRIAPLLLLVALVGCATKQSFDVSVRNNTDQPLTVGFVKVGTPADPAWAPPESWYQLPPSRQPNTWGIVVDPGTTRGAHVEGEFDPGAAPFLRIYGGEHALADLLAISHNTGDRLDLRLEPGGHNDFIVTLDEHGRIAAKLRALGSPH
jgi:hypothetical protein